MRILGRLSSCRLGLENICSIAHDIAMMIAGEMIEAANQEQAMPGRSEIDAAGRAIGRMPQRTLLRLAGVLRADGDLASARILIDASRTAYGESVGWLEEAARLAYSEGDFPEAERLLTTRRSMHPSASADVALGRFLLDRKRIDDAEKIAAPMLASYPDHVTVSMLGADLARAQGQREVARGYYLAVVDARGEHPSGLLMMAELSLEDQDREVAVAFLKRTVSAYRSGDYPLAAPIALRVAAVASQLGDDAVARDFTERAAATQRESREKMTGELWDAYNELGVADTPPDPPPFVDE